MRWRRRSWTTSNTRQASGCDPADDERRASFTAFYDEHAPAVIRYCRVRIGNTQNAEDVAAQVFTQAWRAYPPDDRGSSRSWLFTIAHNTVVNFYRYQKARGPNHPLDDHRALAMPDDGETPEDAFLRREDVSALTAALDSLPANQREVVELRIAGLKGSETAAVTGRSEGAVKMLQWRAMGRLREHLMQEPGTQRVKGTRMESVDAGN